MLLDHFSGTKKCNYNKEAHFNQNLVYGKVKCYWCMIVKATGGYSSFLLKKISGVTMSWFSARLTGFFVCVWGNANSCVYTHVCLWDGPISINSATTKAAVQGYPHKAASICFAVMSACLSLSFSLCLTSLPHIPLNFICLYPSVRFHIKASELWYWIYWGMSSY